MPDAHGLIIRGGGETGTIRRPRDGDHRFAVTTQNQQLLTGDSMPDLHCLIVRGGGQPKAVRRPGYRPDARTMALQGVQEPTLPHIVYLYRTIRRAARHPRAIGRPADAQHISVTCEQQLTASGGNLPHLLRFVARAGDDRGAIGRPGHRPDGLTMPIEAMQHPTRACFPELHSAISGGRSDARAVGGPAHSMQPVAMPFICQQKGTGTGEFWLRRRCQRLDKSLDVRKSGLRVFLQRLHDDLLYFRRDRRLFRAERGRRAVIMLIAKLNEIALRERRLAAQPLIDDDRQAILVTEWRSVATKLLWSHISCCAADMLRGVGALRNDSNAEIAQQQFATSSHQHVLRLDVAVYQLLTVSIAQRLCQLPEIAQYGCQWNALPTRVTLAQRAIGGIFHDQKRVAIFDLKVEQAHNMGMGQCGNQLGLVLEELYIGPRHMRLQIFDRGLLSGDAHVLPKINTGKAALTQ